MTINHVRMAFEEAMPSNQKFVFVVLCDMANSENACWPGIWLISRRTSMPEEIVLNELKALKAAGFIEMIKNSSYMGKVRSQLILVYPDKSNNKSGKKVTSYSSVETRSRPACSAMDEKNKNQPVPAREIAARQLAELKNKLAGA